jgi:uncharacterized protein YjbI with pentapeptide repeats
VRKSSGAAGVAPPDADDLNALLNAHRQWIDSEKSAGRRADLRGAPLDSADLRGADLRHADLGGANLRGADLTEADLRGADLTRARLEGATLSRADLQEAMLQGADLRRANISAADLRRANLRGCSFRDADLQEADLTDVVGLLEVQFAGADLSGARLPEAVAKFCGLSAIAEASHNASALLFSLLVGCLYTWLTVASTTDAQLLTNADSSPLPIIGTPVLIAGFYWIAPLLLLGLYIYFHLGLQRLWEGLAGLPALFPDGRPLHQQIYPWFLSGLVCAHFHRLRPMRPPLFRLQNGVTKLLAWWIVPITLGLLWVRYLPRHDWSGTGVHIVLMAAAVGFCLLSQRLARRTLRGEADAGLTADSGFAAARGVRAGRAYGRAVLVGQTSAFTVAFSLLSYGAIEGAREMPGSPIQAGAVQILVPLAFSYVGYSTFASLEQADVSKKPEGWVGRTEDLGLVKRARLDGRSLRFAEAARAFLVNADLRFADLRGADLWGADLRAAEIRGADLRKANLTGARMAYVKLLAADIRAAQLAGADLESADLSLAKLQDADLVSAVLRHADLGGAELQGAILAGADLEGANLSGTQLAETNFIEANLRGARFYGAHGIEPEQIGAANNWQLAFYSDELLHRLGLAPSHNKALEAALSAGTR